MPTLNDRATRLTARVAPYREAIAKARKAGLTWADIGRLLGLEAPPAALRQAVKRCVYETEQIPLPEPQAAPAPARPSAAQASQAAPTSGQESSIKRLKI